MGADPKHDNLYVWLCLLGAAVFWGLIGLAVYYLRG